MVHFYMLSSLDLIGPVGHIKAHLFLACSFIDYFFCIQGHFFSDFILLNLITSFKPPALECLTIGWVMCQGKFCGSIVPFNFQSTKDSSSSQCGHLPFWYENLSFN